ncbi:hypothetical protein ABUP50_001724 [Cronobacter malonaticus]|uniref:hypothetical protein n=1 Tax=Cronobacter malonaticus TaxID=413503 RepID=UPI000CFD4652|nr:hypothetical protein [Cronobacter malonaticus]ELY5855595.1 hypothetical protein [Cronobacter malonaticus]WRU13674.1 hypothetical protein U9L39_15780 [Cronobacter malonaticus]
MSTISTEQAKDLRNAFECWQQDYDPVEDKEQYEMFGLGVVAMDELLALRKERERAEPFVCPKCGNTGLADSGGVQPWGEPILIECDCTSPPAPSTDDDSLPYDPQIAEYEQMMEAEQAQADTTSQQFESLAGKSVVPEGWKLVPAQPTQAMCDAVLGWACFTFNGDGAKRIYEAMLGAAPEPCK